MINLEQLSQYQDSLGYLGQQIIFRKVTFHQKYLKKPFLSLILAMKNCLHIEIMMNYTLSEIKAIYTDTFDFSKTPTLYDI